MESLEKTSVSYSLAPYGTASAFTSSADGGSGHKSHDGGMKSHDYKLGKTSFDSKESTDGGFTLPSFDTPSGIQSDGMPIPRMKQLSGSRGDGSDGDSDSSDWSSSGDEGDGLSADMKPTSHAALISEWEWRVMKEEGGNAQPITSRCVCIYVFNVFIYGSMLTECVSGHKTCTLIAQTKKQPNNSSFSGLLSIGSNARSKHPTKF